MTQTSPHALERLVLAFLPCPYCQAGPTKPCVTKSGVVATWPHSARSKPIYQAWSIGYREANSDLVGMDDETLMRRVAQLRKQPREIS